MQYTRQRLPACTCPRASGRARAPTDDALRVFFSFPSMCSRSASTREECENFYSERDAVTEMNSEKGTELSVKSVKYFSVCLSL